MNKQKEAVFPCERCGKEIHAKSEMYSYMMACNRALNTVTTIHLCQRCYNKFLAFMEEEEDESNNSSCGDTQ